MLRLTSKTAKTVVDGNGGRQAKLQGKIQLGGGMGFREGAGKCSAGVIANVEHCTLNYASNDMEGLIILVYGASKVLLEAVQPLTTN